MQYKYKWLKNLYVTEDPNISTSDFVPKWREKKKERGKFVSSNQWAWKPCQNKLSFPDRDRNQIPPLSSCGTHPWATPHIPEHVQESSTGWEEGGKYSFLLLVHEREEGPQPLLQVVECPSRKINFVFFVKRMKQFLFRLNKAKSTVFCFSFPRNYFFKLSEMQDLIAFHVEDIYRGACKVFVPPKEHTKLRAEFWCHQLSLDNHKTSSDFYYRITEKAHQNLHIHKTFRKFRGACLNKLGTRKKQGTLTPVLGDTSGSWEQVDFYRWLMTCNI